tara:strand:+ start:130 stop:312 length:183 start_codon:yes stop_codon:yes gene_type:complete
MPTDEIIQELYNISEEIEEYSNVLYNDEYVRKSRKSKGLRLLAMRIHEVRKLLKKIKEGN